MNVVRKTLMTDERKPALMPVTKEIWPVAKR